MLLSSYLSFTLNKKKKVHINQWLGIDLKFTYDNSKLIRYFRGHHNPCDYRILIPYLRIFYKRRQK